MNDTKTRFRVAAVQVVSSMSVEDNLREADRLIGEAAALGACLVVLPEYFALISSDERAKVSMRERDGDGRLQNFLAQTSKRHGVYVVGGTVPLVAEADDKVRNACLVYDDQGHRLARYDKLHLFGFEQGSERYDESATIESGHEVISFDGPFGRIGVGICYDLRFPELFRAMGDVSMIVLPAAFTYTTGQAHWEVLLRARAIENQCYVLASAQGGVHESGRRTYGHSMLIDPWGNVLSYLATGPGVVAGEIDLAQLEDVRTRLPALRHKKLHG